MGNIASRVVQKTIDTNLQSRTQSGRRDKREKTGTSGRAEVKMEGGDRETDIGGPKTVGIKRKKAAVTDREKGVRKR